MPSLPRSVLLALALVAGSLVAAPGSAAPAAPDRPSPAPSPRSTGGWVGTWSAAMTPPGDGTSVTGFTDTTLRQVVRVSAGGARVRLRLANTYGERALRVGRVTIGRRSGGAGTPRVARSTVRVVRFGGRVPAAVPPGAELVSDPIGLPVPARTDLVVSVHLPAPTGPTTWHPAGYATSFVADGDRARDPGAAYRALDTSRYFLSGVDVAPGRRPAPRGAVVLFGDSITDGVDSTVDADRRYPDQVADRLAARPAPRRCGVVNAGISGNQLLRDAGAAGDRAPARFWRDALSRPGARSVVVLEGINDIGVSAGAVTPAELIAVHRQLIRRAHSRGVRAVGATLTPYEGAGYYSEAGEADRQALNRWIRTSGAYDAVVDFDRALRDPDDPGRMLPAYDTGDHLHPNDAGFRRMAQELDLREVC